MYATPANVHKIEGSGRIYMSGKRSQMYTTPDNVKKVDVISDKSYMYDKNNQDFSCCIL